MLAPTGGLEGSVEIQHCEQSPDVQQGTMLPGSTTAILEEEHLARRSDWHHMPLMLHLRNSPHREVPSR